MLETTFFILLSLVLYSYILYGVFLWTASLFLKRQVDIEDLCSEDLPEVTLMVAAFNEKDFLHEKITNSLALDYPSSKLKHIWVTDGSDDGTPSIIKQTYPEIEVLHEDARNGKIGAINRGMSFVKTKYVIFCDANTYLNTQAIKKIVAQFVSNEKVGCVAGEKKIFSNKKDRASGAGEGIYWKYESFIKRAESKFGSTLGAAGELFAIRTELYEPVEKDTILDDFTISMRIAKKGYTVQYCPEAYATETSSVNVKEELKRKIRIASGGLQSTIRLSSLLNPIKYPEISFKFISHKLMRWLVVPFCFIALYILNLILIKDFAFDDLFSILLVMQTSFYGIAVIGFFLEQKEIRLKILFIPYYIVIMNYAAIAGIIRFLRKSQNVNWARAERKIINTQ